MVLHEGWVKGSERSKKESRYQLQDGSLWVGHIRPIYKMGHQQSKDAFVFMLAQMPLLWVFFNKLKEVLWTFRVLNLKMYQH